ncbi:MAG: beta-ribofuranosylaminobenzene 5'-phosphate synthase family protein [Candidatus Altiarchaeota archaeon]
MEYTITAPSRLHLGIFDVGGKEGQSFGAVGIALKKPRFTLSVRSSENFVSNNLKDYRIDEFTKRFSRCYNIGSKAEFSICEEIPAHSGLGSGTQLALSVATLLAELNGVKGTVSDLAKAMGRGRRSRVGTKIFENGGFVFDPGRNGKVQNFKVPLNWRFILVNPRIEKGVSGAIEDSFFSSLKSDNGFSSQVTEIVLSKMIPSLKTSDIILFGESLTELDVLVGEYFRLAQKGTFRHPEINEIIKKLKALGCYGVGQSSWGPTVYGLTILGEAENVLLKTRDFLQTRRLGGEVWVSEVQNFGAQIVKKNRIN